MRKNSFLMPGLVLALLFLVTSLKANHLDGLWRNDRQNITIRIEQDNEGFRARRIDQGIWYRYRQEDNDVYVDRNGNWYEVLDDDELEWNEAGTNKRFVFHRVGYREDERENGRNDRWEEDDRWSDDPANYANALEGRWYNRSTKERLDIEEIRGGFSVKTQHGARERYMPDRRANRLRSAAGNTIQMLDRNTIRWSSYQGRHERIYVRQGNSANDRANDRYDDRYDDRINDKNAKGKKYGHRAKEDGRGRSKSCG